MLFKYWVEFDEEDIVGLYKEPTPNCVECVVKITPIKRNQNNDELEKVGKDTIVAAKRFKTELQRISKDLRRIRA